MLFLFTICEMLEFTFGNHYWRRRTTEERRTSEKDEEMADNDKGAGETTHVSLNFCHCYLNRTCICKFLLVSYLISEHATV